MSKHYTVKRTINGTEYTAQFNGISAAYEAFDNSYIEGTSNISIETLSEHLLDHIIVEPKLTIEDFGKDLIGKTETRVINGKEYTAEFKGLRVAMKSVDENYIDGTENISVEKSNAYILENIITSPKDLTLDDFESTDEVKKVVAFGREVMQGWGLMKEFNEVTAFARGVMQGNFREKAVKKATSKQSKE